MSLRASSSVLGLHFLGVRRLLGSTSNKATKNFRLDIPKFSAKQRVSWITSLQEDTFDVYQSLHLLPTFVVSLLLFCVKGTSFHQQLVSAAWLKLGEHYAQGGLTAGLCGSQTRGLSRNGPRGKLGNSIKTDFRPTSVVVFKDINKKMSRMQWLEMNSTTPRLSKFHRSYWTTRTKLTRPWTFVISNLDSVTSSCCCSRIANSSRSCSLSSCQLNLHKKWVVFSNRRSKRDVYVYFHLKSEYDKREKYKYGRACLRIKRRGDRN